MGFVIAQRVKEHEVPKVATTSERNVAGRGFSAAAVAANLVSYGIAGLDDMIQDLIHPECTAVQPGQYDPSPGQPDDAPAPAHQPDRRRNGAPGHACHGRGVRRVRSRAR